ncbi:MAG: hypothetical protein ACK5TO_18785 [Planctomycetaceae bacterium]
MRRWWTGIRTGWDPVEAYGDLTPRQGIVPLELAEPELVEHLAV